MNSSIFILLILLASTSFGELYEVKSKKVEVQVGSYYWDKEFACMEVMPVGQPDKKVTTLDQAIEKCPKSFLDYTDVYVQYLPNWVKINDLELINEDTNIVLQEYKDLRDYIYKMAGYTAKLNVEEFPTDNGRIHYRILDSDAKDIMQDNRWHISRLDVTRERTSEMFYQVGPFYCVEGRYNGSMVHASCSITLNKDGSLYIP